jgi:hypothetical protein
MGGGGGGGDPGAEARKQEKQRQKRIAAATQEINRIFNNEVQQTGTRYRVAPTQAPGGEPNDVLGHGLSKMFSKEEGPQYISEQEYKNRLNSYNAAPAKQKGEGKLSLDKLRGEGRLSLDKQAILNTFNPNAFKAESYEYWAPGDPANSRDALYQQHRDAVYNINKLDVDRQATEAERFNRFGLARAGLLGGSADIDSNADLNRRTNEGLMRAGGVADQAAADLKVSDERTRSNLISMAQSGIDTGSAASLALNGLKANADSVVSQRAGASIGGLFNDLSQAYLINQGNQGRMAGATPGYGQWTGVSNPRSGDSGRVGK